MRENYVRAGETHPQYIGDGVYVAFDGYQVWLRAERDGMLHEIAIEPAVWGALRRYVTALQPDDTP